MKHIWTLSSVILLAVGLISVNSLELSLEEVQAVAVSYPVRLAYIDRINQWWPP